MTIAASAQRYNDYGLEILDSDKVESNLRLAFPMYFGVSALINNDRADLNTLLPQNFTYAIEMASVRFKAKRSHLEASFGVRWTFMDFSLEDTGNTFRKVFGEYYRYPIIMENLKYDGTKSKLHATYLGVPVRLSYKAGKGRVYVGASAEYLVNGYTKYRKPAYREGASDMFNRFRATAEAGFSYRLFGVFFNYGITPLFPKDWSGANTVSFGLTFGI